MATGWITWTCMLLAVNGPADDGVVHINQRAFQIPVKVPPDRQSAVRELILYMSRDQGRTWEVHARNRPDSSAFDINTAADGLLLFNIAVIDKQGRQDPPDIYNAPVGQKVLIDTVKPEVHIVSANRVGEEIKVAWDVREQFPDWESLRLEYRVGDSPTAQWVPLPVQGGEHGIYTLRPGMPGDVTLRLQLADRAKNVGIDEKVVPAAGGGMVDRAIVGAGAVEPIARPPVSGVPGTGTPGTGTPPPPPAVGGPAGPTAVQTHSAPSPPPAMDGTPLPPLGGVSPANNPPGPGASNPVAQSAPPQGLPQQGGRPGVLPDKIIVNKKQAKLEYDVAGYGPSGVGSVEVYVTEDEGITWTSSRPEPSPVTAATADSRGEAPLIGSVMVPLPKDGVTYGFFLVVKSRAGLGAEPPRSGDAPQIRIEADSSPPVAELYGPEADRTRPNAVILSWKASDRNLAPNPISLEWATSPAGPWLFIGEPQLPNSGRFSWQVPDRTPPKVLLRLTVRDVAGNTAVAVTPEPVVIDVAKPVVTGVRFVPNR